MRTVTAILCLAAAIMAQTASAAPVQERAILSMTEICPTWRATCVTACTALSSSATATSACSLSSARSLGSISCKCGSKDLTSKVLRSYLTGNLAAPGTVVPTADVNTLSPHKTLAGNAVVPGAEATMVVRPTDILLNGSSKSSSISSTKKAATVVVANGAQVKSPQAKTTSSSSSKATSTKSSSSSKISSSKSSSTKPSSTKSTSSRSSTSTTKAATKVNAHIESAVPITDAW